jgi:RNA polymerase-binding transcription factor DksA
MAIKKKLAKPAKKSSPKKPAKQPPKKQAAIKKAAPKPVVKKLPAKKSVKAITKKVPAVKKTAIAKPLPKKPIAPAPKVAAIKPGMPAAKPQIKKQEYKPEVKGTAPVPVRLEQKKQAHPGKPVKVVIPEIKTKTVRKYEPEFTKSVLDTYQQETTGPTMRYSDVELAEFRDLIMKKLDAAKKELTYLQGLITRKDEMGGDDTDNRYMTMEDGSMSMEREQLSQMASRQITFIDHLEKALMRIENKTYGICRVTGKLIDKARLRAVPHATLSIEAKQTMNK